MNRLQRRVFSAWKRKRDKMTPQQPPKNIEMQIQATPQPDGNTIAVVITFGPIQHAVLIPVTFMPQVIAMMKKALDNVPKVLVPTIIGVNGKSQA